MLDLDQLHAFDQALAALSQGALPPTAAGPLPRDISARLKDLAREGAAA